MNGQIKELAKQTSNKTDEILDCIGEFHADYGAIWNETFAHLIIQECINKAREEEDRFYGIGEDDLALTMEHFQEVLKQHFGVE